jgi:hypothetical protein
MESATPLKLPDCDESRCIAQNISDRTIQCNNPRPADNNYCSKAHKSCRKSWFQYKGICDNIKMPTGKPLVKSMVVNMNKSNLKQLEQGRINAYNSVKNCIEARRNHQTKCVYKQCRDIGHETVLKSLQDQLNRLESDLRVLYYQLDQLSLKPKRIEPEPESESKADISQLDEQAHRIMDNINTLKSELDEEERAENESLTQSHKEAI